MVQPGQQQQLVDEATHTLGFLVDAPHGVVEVAPGLEAAAPVEVAVAADRGERRPELVGRVTHEAAQPILRRLAFVEHLVHGHGQAPGLGRRRCFLDPERGVAGRDGIGGGGHSADGPEPQPPDPPRQQRHDGDDGQRAEPECHPQPVGGPVDAVEGKPHDQCAPVAPADGQHPEVAVARGPDGERLPTRGASPDLPGREGRGGAGAAAEAGCVPLGHPAVGAGVADPQFAQRGGRVPVLGLVRGNVATGETGLAGKGDAADGARRVVELGVDLLDEERPLGRGHHDPGDDHGDDHRGDEHHESDPEGHGQCSIRIV